MTKPRVKIYRYDDGLLRSKEYRRHGLYHHDTKPAYQRWYPNGQKEIEEWFKDGYIHRIDGPALKEWYYDGMPRISEWYINGDDRTEEILEWIEKYNIALEDGEIVKNSDKVLFSLKWM